MHENEMKCFSKAQVLNPSFPKIKIFNHSPFKNSNTEYVYKTQSNFKLGWLDRKTRTITCTMFSKE